MEITTFDRKYIYDMEFIRSEMELKYHEFRLKNPLFDLSDMENKISIMEGVIIHIYKVYDLLENQQKAQVKLELLNTKLLSELLILKTNE